MLKIVNEISVRARVRARVCVGNARQCDDDRGMQGKGKPTIWLKQVLSESRAAEECDARRDAEECTNVCR